MKPPRMICPDDDLETNAQTLARLLAEAREPVCNCGASTAAPLRDHYWACSIVRAVEQ